MENGDPLRRNPAVASETKTVGVHGAVISRVRYERSLVSSHVGAEFRRALLVTNTSHGTFAQYATATAVLYSFSLNKRMLYSA